MCQRGNCDGSCIHHEHECRVCGKTEPCTDKACRIRHGVCPACDESDDDDDWDAFDYACSDADAANKGEKE